MSSSSLGAPAATSAATANRSNAPPGPSSSAPTTQHPRPRVFSRADGSFLPPISSSSPLYATTASSSSPSSDSSHATTSTSTSTSAPTSNTTTALPPGSAPSTAATSASIIGVSSSDGHGPHLGPRRTVSSNAIQASKPTRAAPLPPRGDGGAGTGSGSISGCGSGTGGSAYLASVSASNKVNASSAPAISRPRSTHPHSPPPAATSAQQQASSLEPKASPLSSSVSTTSLCGNVPPLKSSNTSASSLKTSTTSPNPIPATVQIPDSSKTTSVVVSTSQSSTHSESPESSTCSNKTVESGPERLKPSNKSNSRPTALKMSAVDHSEMHHAWMRMGLCVGDAASAMEAATSPFPPSISASAATMTSNTLPSPPQYLLASMPNDRRPTVGPNISGRPQLAWSTMRPPTRSSIWVMNGTLTAMAISSVINTEKEFEMYHSTISRKEGAEIESPRHKSADVYSSAGNIQSVVSLENQDEAIQSAETPENHNNSPIATVTLMPHTRRKKVVIAESARELQHHLNSSTATLNHSITGGHRHHHHHSHSHKRSSSQSVKMTLLDLTTTEGALQAATNLSAYIEKHVTNEFLYVAPEVVPDVSGVKRQAASLSILMRLFPPLHTACYALLDLITDFPGVLIPEPFADFLDTHIPCAFKPEVLFAFLESDAIAFWNVLLNHIRFCVQHGRDVPALASAFSGRLIQVAPPSWSNIQEFKLYAQLVEYLDRPQDSLSFKVLERVLVEDCTFVLVRGLCRNCAEKTELPLLMRSLLRICARHNLCLPLFQKLLAEDIAESKSLSNVLENHSLPALLFKQLIHNFAKDYLVQSLKPAVAIIAQSADAFVVKSAGKSEAKHRQTEEQQLTVLKTIQKTLEHILNSCSSCPMILRQIFRLFQDLLVAKYKLTETARHQFVGEKLLFHLYCLPLREGLQNLFPPQMSTIDQVPLQKILTTIAEVLPLIASGGHPFNPNLEFLTPWALSKASSLFSFLDFFVEVDTSITKTPPWRGDLLLDLTIVNNKLLAQSEILVEELSQRYIRASSKLTDFIEATTQLDSSI
ncbi:hypothetical protein Pelo_13721 [Pelomyxa schiedti]|nr:hypothetical protein Pelo_13721 [Pelomyxa schiedti]